MATLFKPTRPYPLPAGAEITEKDCKRHVRIRDRGRAVLYPLTKDGKKYLKPSEKWYAKYRDANGAIKLTPLSPNKGAAKLMLADLLKKVENEKLGIRDPFEKHRKKPLTGHLDDWLISLKSKDSTPEYVSLRGTRVRAVVEACGWAFPGDMTADRLDTFLAGRRKGRPELPVVPEGG